MTATGLGFYPPVHEGRIGNRHHTPTPIHQIERPKVNPLPDEMPENLRKNDQVRSAMIGGEVCCFPAIFLSFSQKLLDEASRTNRDGKSLPLVLSLCALTCA